jgi:rhodanese-related sulfurtransferase
MFGFIKNLFKSNYETLSGSAFKELFRNTPGGILLDVRSPAEFSRGTIKGARNMNVSDASFNQKMASLDTSKTYFVFCAAGARSAAACSRLSSAGLKVYNLAGGINSWPKS